MGDNSKIFLPIHLRLEDQILRSLDRGKNLVQILGCSSPLAVGLQIAFSFSSKIRSLPFVVITSSLDEALAVESAIAFFSSDLRCHISYPYDVSPYSGLYPSPQVSRSRVRFNYWAAHATTKDVFVLPVQSLIQNTAPFFEFAKRCRKLKVGDELPSSLAEWLVSLGYQAAPLVEDVGQFSWRGGIVDIFSPAEDAPVRIELFGDQIESIRRFSTNDQRSLDTVDVFHLIPTTEVEIKDENIESIVRQFRVDLKDRSVPASEVEETIRSLSLMQNFPGIEFILPYCYKNLSSPLEHFSIGLNLVLLDPANVSRAADEYSQELKAEYNSSSAHIFRPPLEKLFSNYESTSWPEGSCVFQWSRLTFLESEKVNEAHIDYNSQPLTEFSQLALNMVPGSQSWESSALPKMKSWLDSGYKIFVATKNQLQSDRLKILLDRLGLQNENKSSSDFSFGKWFENPHEITLVQRSAPDTLLLNEEKIIFLRADDFFGKKQKSASKSSYDQFSEKAKSLAFGDLKPNDYVVHVKHGIGVYEGLKIMNIGGVDSEYIQIAYKDKDKLYLPVYRIGQLQKYSGATAALNLDKLGGQGWEKTKIKVKAHLRDIASELLLLYAKRAKLQRPPVPIDEILTNKFDQGFPYEETDDQMKAITDIHKDLSGPKPMDRLICGDVGFGKTEVSMRAAFEVAQSGRQVAVLAPTTVLTFQHLETFKKRFSGWDFNIKSLNRFVPPAEQKKTLADLKEGKVHILIGTHRLLSKDVQFKNLGLLIVDEEQKFGVLHKEKIKKMRADVDTLTLSATPIPRTLNMSFTGLRDLSIINTAPVDRLPTRTFISKFDPDLIRKAVKSEVARGGQVYFIHNRVQSIYALADELRQILPEVRMKVAHGQMSEDELEQAMLAFFHHEIDMLVCTAIVESGMDVPRANTMFIDQAHMFGLAQLYQLRGRVGRSKARAYCYLLLPKEKKIEKDAQERLKIIQDNSALGSGIRIAQYDLELRGAGNILGDDQSGHVNAVGYELYMDLLNETLAEAKGEVVPDRDLDPEINLRIPALIPDSYIADIRIRLSYYKALAEIKSQDDLDRIEEELRDQFGELPEPVINLMGLMLLRKLCKDLGVRDISAGVKNISLIFTDKTRLKPETAIKLATRENKKYSLTPDQRLNIRMNSITWSNVYEELNYLLSLI